MSFRMSWESIPSGPLLQWLPCHFWCTAQCTRNIQTPRLLLQLPVSKPWVCLPVSAPARTTGELTQIRCECARDSRRLVNTDWWIVMSISGVSQLESRIFSVFFPPPYQVIEQGKIADEIKARQIKRRRKKILVSILFHDRSISHDSQWPAGFLFPVE